MDSPSAQLLGEDSVYDHYSSSHSSPFLSEANMKSRNTSLMHDGDIVSREDHAMPDMLETPVKMGLAFGNATEDKENLPVTGSVRKASTPPPADGDSILHNSVSMTPSVLQSSHMGPPAPRSMHKTPRMSPTKTWRTSTETPQTVDRASFRDSMDEETSHSVHPRSSARRRAVPSAPADAPGLDDTCLSTFSEIPDMTMYTKLGRDALSNGAQEQYTPRPDIFSTPRTSRKRSSPSRSPSPTPRRLKTPAVYADQDSTTGFLIDFTQQFEGVGTARNASPVKSRTESNLAQYMQGQRSPNKIHRQSQTPMKPNNILSLLDFELPPAPTPRSLPTITVRELESLKSSYMSQISNLKATLSGREAEVESLKKAVGDAERRVGEAQEALRDERFRREEVEQEKSSWEKRGQEVENVLNNVREEVMKSEAEKENMQNRIEELERIAEDAENRATKAEERFAESLAARAVAGEGNEKELEEQVQRLAASQIDAKIEAVSRELHAVYKEKHERKVSTLKKSYEARSEKKCADLQAQLTALEKQHEDLLAAKDATFSGPLSDSTSAEATAALKADVEHHKAAHARLEHELATARAQHDQLARELQQERIEKGDLVAAVDEMMALQAEQPTPHHPSSSSRPVESAMSVVADFRKSVSRVPPPPPTSSSAPSAAGLAQTSGLKTPGGAESRIARGGGGAGAFGKSRMLANIERMGRTGHAPAAPSAAPSE